MSHKAGSSDGLDALSIKELKQECKRKKIDTSNCLEKDDLVKQLRTNNFLGAETDPGTSTATASKQEGDASPKPLVQLPISKLKRLIEIHDLKETTAGARERGELEQALQRVLGRCPICLEDVECSFETSSEVRQCSSCCANFDRACAAGHMLQSAESGQLPLLCPVQGCRMRWPADLVSWALDEDQLRRYNTAVRTVREQRQNKGNAGNISPRSAEALRKIGIRTCPECGCAIEKQDSTLTTGCDKMTCRCGCRFCFKCGIPATPDGAPQCSCVAAYHQYLTHGDVLNNYPSTSFVDNLAGGFGTPDLGPFFAGAAGAAGAAPPPVFAGGGAPPPVFAAGGAAAPPQMAGSFLQNVVSHAVGQAMHVATEHLSGRAQGFQGQQNFSRNQSGGGGPAGFPHVFAWSNLNGGNRP
eukprot:TRINITY_DN5265_c0_g1_i1.p1 TRINITY_DN5265_c0_g1~~TRINITY_DN5265_c0_g1_i1.p1  ORF type:complete len:421 (+),score=70.25 TRINITY_DN5265_c0_g1_i1:22-1263(+)